MLIELTNSLKRLIKAMPDFTGHIPASDYSNKIFIADKPLDFTSADIVRIFKKHFHIDKIGHAGSLDPKATGLLILCSGIMTKKNDFFMNLEKEYSGIFRIGATTKSFDTEKEEENLMDTDNISNDEIQKARECFIGEIEQIPPMYSALKYKGKPLYKLARKGDTVERKPRRILIKEFDAIQLNKTEVFFRVVCSKGTYLRALAYDFGVKLGVGAYLKELRRTRIGDYVLTGLTEEVRNIKFKVV